MPKANARSTSIGLALVAGPIVFAILSPVLNAQDYIDVEAERRAAQAAPRAGSYSTTYPPDTTGSQVRPGAAVSYGVADAPPAAPVTRLPPPSAPAENVAGLFNQVQQLQQEVMRLNGLVEEQAFELRTLKEQSLERYLDIDRRLAGGAAAGAMTTGGDVSAGGAAVLGSGLGSREAAEQPGEAEAYQAAYALVRGQEFDNAVTAFTGFLRSHPDGRYAPNAHYWLGELYLVVDPADPEAARQAFMLLLQQYPDHTKVPDALYKLGRVQFMKGNRPGAREFLDRVIREYPSSSAARLASDFIDQNL